jgi:PEP-CTERM motif
MSSVLINMNGTPVSIADLALQPSTDTIFGIQSPNDANFSGTANLYTISTTGAATLVGNTGVFFGSIAFAPNGTLYMTSADLPTTTGNCANGNDINCALSTLNPATAATLTSVPVVDFYSSLGISPSGVIWAGNGGGDIGGPGIGQFYPGVSILNPTTGNATFIGNTGTNFVGDIAFQPIPEPASFVLVGIGLAMVAARRSRRVEKR